MSSVVSGQGALSVEVASSCSAATVGVELVSPWWAEVALVVAAFGAVPLVELLAEREL